MVKVGSERYTPLRNLSHLGDAKLKNILPSPLGPWKCSLARKNIEYSDIRISSLLIKVQRNIKNCRCPKSGDFMSNLFLGNQINLKVCGVVREDLWYFGWTNAVCWRLICERYHYVSCSDFFCLRRADLLSCFINELDIRLFLLLSRFTNKLGIRRTFQMPVKMFARGRKNIFQFRFA